MNLVQLIQAMNEFLRGSELNGEGLRLFNGGGRGRIEVVEGRLATSKAVSAS